MTFNEALTETRAALSNHHCEGADAAHESTDLLSFAANMTREKLLVSGHENISTPTLRKLRTLVAKRLRHTPLAHLLGKAHFYGHEFKVTKATLIPRPATELLLEAALATTPNATTIIDIGTGSGCIAISASLARTQANVVAIDLSKSALRMAKKNAQVNGARVMFLHGDLLSPITLSVRPGSRGVARRVRTRVDERPQDSADQPKAGSTDGVPQRHEHASRRAAQPPGAWPDGPTLIVANLPYIPSSAYKNLSLDIRKNEPCSALVSGKDGLAHYRRLLIQLKKTPHLATTLACEILPAQKKPLTTLIKKAFPSAKTTPITTGDGTTIGIIATW